MTAPRMFILSVTFGFLSQTFASETDGYSKTFEKCINESGGITSEILECNNAELNKQEARMKKFYSSAMKSLAAENKSRLKNSQQLWLKYREINCDIHYTLSGGTMDLINGSSCFLDFTKNRADDLEEISEMTN